MRRLQADFGRDGGAEPRRFGIGQSDDLPMQPGDDEPGGEDRHRGAAIGWRTPGAVRLHVTLLVVFPGCLAAAWWQFDAARSGNTLSWLYTFEWPLFAGYAVYMWAKLLRDQDVVGMSGADLASSGSGVAEPAHVGSVAPAPPRPASSAVAAALGPVSMGSDPGVEQGLDQRSESDGELEAYNRYLAELANG